MVLMVLMERQGLYSVDSRARAGAGAGSGSSDSGTEFRGFFFGGRKTAYCPRIDIVIYQEWSEIA
jgi:hypothetical protein